MPVEEGALVREGYGKEGRHDHWRESIRVGKRFGSSKPYYMRKRRKNPDGDSMR